MRVCWLPRVGSTRPLPHRAERLQLQVGQEEKMSEVEGEEGENDAKRESDISTAPETDDIVVKKKKVTRRQLCVSGLDTTKATRSRRSRSAKYAGG